jgi:hypothetical protein
MYKVLTSSKLQGIQPVLHSFLETRLNPMSDHTHRGFKKRVPAVQISVLSIKDDTIPFVPNAPATTHQGFFEEKV